MTWTEITGWTLLHFVWQGTLVAAIVAALLHLLRERSPLARYAVACAGLAMMLAAPVMTASMLSAASSAPNTSFGTSGTLGTIGTEVPEVPTVPMVPGDGFMPLVWQGAIDASALLPTLVSLWIAGVAILLTKLAGGCWRVSRLHAIASLEPASRWEDAAARIASRLGVTRAVRIVDSLEVDTPTVIGFLRPVVLLPVAALANLTPAQVEAILAHELAHIRRHDFLVNVLQTVAETLLFYHPAVWWLSRRIRTEREHCCDDIAVEVCGDPYAYAAALTEIAALGVVAPSIAMAATGGSLLQRVRRVLGVRADPRDRRGSGLIALGLALALVVLGGGWRLYVVAQEPRDVDSDNGGVGPRDLQRFLGIELPGRVQSPTEDPATARSWSARISSGSGEMSLIGYTARSLIRDAYGLPEALVEAPGWMDTETFDISIPSAVPVAHNGVSDPALVREALRSYFEGTLNLSWHLETRDFPVYALVRAHADRLGPNVRPAAGGCGFGCGVENDLFGFQARNVTMQEFADDINVRMSPLALDREVVDRTGLTDTYDFEMRIGFLPLAALAQRSEAAAMLFAPVGVRTIRDALPWQLGLKLEESTAPWPVLVIDRIDRPPTQ